MKKEGRVHISQFEFEFIINKYNDIAQTWLWNVTMKK